MLKARAPGQPLGRKAWLHVLILCSHSIKKHFKCICFIRLLWDLPPVSTPPFLKSLSTQKFTNCPIFLTSTVHSSWNSVQHVGGFTAIACIFLRALCDIWPNPKYIGQKHWFSITFTFLRTRTYSFGLFLTKSKYVHNECMKQCNCLAPWNSADTNHEHNNAALFQHFLCFTAYSLGFSCHSGLHKFVKQHLITINLSVSRTVTHLYAGHILNILLVCFRIPLDIMLTRGSTWFDVVIPSGHRHSPCIYW